MLSLIIILTPFVLVPVLALPNPSDLGWSGYELNKNVYASTRSQQRSTGGSLVLPSETRTMAHPNTDAASPHSRTLDKAYSRHTDHQQTEPFAQQHPPSMVHGSDYSQSSSMNAEGSDLTSNQLGVGHVPIPPKAGVGARRTSTAISSARKSSPYRQDAKTTSGSRQTTKSRRKGKGTSSQQTRENNAQASSSNSGILPGQQTIDPTLDPPLSPEQIQNVQDIKNALQDPQQKQILYAAARNMFFWLRYHQTDMCKAIGDIYKSLLPAPVCEDETLWVAMEYTLAPSKARELHKETNCLERLRYDNFYNGGDGRVPMKRKLGCFHYAGTIANLLKNYSTLRVNLAQSS